MPQDFPTEDHEESSPCVWGLQQVEGMKPSVTAPQRCHFLELLVIGFVLLGKLCWVIAPWDTWLNARAFNLSPVRNVI
jgi:hypothetical protein